MPRPLRRAAALVVLTLAGLLAPLVPAFADDPPVPTSIAVVAPAQVRVGSTITLKATLTADPGTPLAGEALVLEQIVDGTWTPVGTSPTNASGTATFTGPAPAANPHYRVRYSGSTAYGAALSETTVVSTIVVVSTITLTGPRKILDESTGVLHVSWKGADGPAVVGGTVKLYTRPAAEKTWRLLDTLKTGSKGTVDRMVRPRVDTLYKVTGSAGTGWKADTSTVLTIDNVPPGVPVVLPAKASKPKVLAAQKRAVGAGANVVVSAISAALWKKMVGITWHRGCPIGRSQLRLVEVNYYAFDGYRRRGQLVVRSTAVGKFKAALTGLYAAEIPIRYLYLPDRFGYSSLSGGANDYKSMAADNSSAFNCRGVTGNKKVRSPHSYGTAFDLNTWENPYHSKKGWTPNRWWVTHSDKRYAWRSSKHQVVRIMVRAGFRWTYRTSDSQHFDA